jgi:TRAP-type transport system periplasmic protein
MICPDNFQATPMTLHRPWLAAALSAWLFALPAAAQQKFDVSVPWGASEFHTQNAMRFADRVKAETKGEVLLTVHAGATLGVKPNESLRALADGVVPFGEYALFQNASRGAALAVETLPFLVDNLDQLKVLHGFTRPVWNELLTKNKQKALYMVPWPSQYFFVKKPVASIADMKGLRMRSLDKLTTDWINRLGMTPVQLTNPEIVQALGSNMIDGVPTSAGTAAAQKYPEFLGYGYHTNHLWATNVMAVGLDAWNSIKPEHRSTIERVAREMEPEFWAVSQAEDAKRVAELTAKGMKVQPMPKAVVDEMRKLTAELWAEYAKPMGPETEKALAAYRTKTGK